ncbi:MAG: zinc ribbon domain-containing protein [Clostridia bacterium]|nr:zinc ribbon domain-containing protein [Clostridia bacterium]
MLKAEFSLRPGTIAGIAFGFCIMRQPLLVLLVFGYALLVEKDDWINRQVFQALLLSMAYHLADWAVNLIFDGVNGLLRIWGAAQAQNILREVSGFVEGMLFLGLILFAVIAIINVFQGKDASLPFLSGMAGGDVAAGLKRKPRPDSVPAQPGYPPQAAVYAPPQPAQTTHQTSVFSESAQALSCAACGAPLQPDSKFCAGCGAKIGLH